MPLDYVVFMPGRAYSLAEMVEVPDAYDNEGTFMMTVVMSRQANIPTLLWSLISPEVDIIPRRQVMPVDVTQTEHHQMMLRTMLSSQMVASGLAMRYSGYEVQELGEGVLVLSFAEYTYSDRYLEVGDVIVWANGEAISLQPSLTLALAETSPGDIVEFRVLREGEYYDFSFELVPRLDDPEVGAIGIMATTYGWNLELPFDIEVDTQNIGGTSAGLMMTLEIMNQLSEDDLTRGRIIAGSGSINFLGSVGNVAGVRQKVAGAIANNAEFFLIPSGNADEARAAARGSIVIIVVDTLDEALEFLRGIG